MSKTRAVVLLSALLLLMGGFAYASIPASDGTINGCYDNSTGDLRVIDSAATCAGGETALDWDQSGLSGGDVVYFVTGDTGSIPAGGFKSAVAICPPGTQVISGGFQNFDSGHVDIVTSQNSGGDPPDRWVIQVRNREPVAAQKTRVHAICMPID